MREKSNSLARYALMISWRIIHFHAFYCLLSLHSYPINPSSPPAFPSSFSLSHTLSCGHVIGMKESFFFAHSSVMITETVLKFNTYPQKINVHARNGDVGGGGWWKDTEKNEKQNFLKKGNFAYKFLCYFSALKAFCNFEILSHSLTHSISELDVDEFCGMKLQRREPVKYIHRKRGTTLHESISNDHEAFIKCLGAMV